MRGVELKFLKFWFPFFFYSGIIFWASSIPSLKPSTDFVNIDKICHVLEYSIWGWLLTRAVYAQCPTWSVGKILCWVVLFSLLYGVSDEYHQGFIVGRESSSFDVTADMIGGFLGAVVYFILFKKLNFRLRVD